MGLQPLPQTFATTREALHLVAERLVAPARKPHNEIALRATPGGFGTPPFELGDQRLEVRVEGAELIVERGDATERAPISDLASAARLLGPDLLVDGMPEDATPLEIDPEAAARLGAFYGFGARVLEAFRASLPAADEPSDINLWPEHFDIAFEAGAEATGTRANYGASPGDAEHSEPYLYVGPWAARPEGELWNATAFGGAELGYAELVAAADAEALALDFLRSRHVALAG
jgi:hypothetical protein